MNILAYTSRSLLTKENHVNLHFAHLSEISDNITLLSMNKTDKGALALKDIGVPISATDSFFTELYKNYYLDNCRKECKKYNNWLEIYDELDVSAYEKYDLLYIAAGMCLPNSKICHGGQIDFPLKGPMTFVSHAVRIMNILAMIKIHNTYGTPLHEFALDPDELSSYMWHKDIAPKIGEHYYLYHSYDNPKYNIRRLDSNQYYESKYSLTSQINKTIDLTFGYTYKLGCREQYIESLENFMRNNSDKNIKIYKRELSGDAGNFLSRHSYLEEIRKSRFTYIMPSYWSEFFSGFRFIESLARDTLPIIDKHCNTEDISNTFNVDFDILKLDKIPSEDFRLKQLEIFKDKVLTCRVLLEGVSYPEKLKFHSREITPPRLSDLF